jgi:hypothetical protein
MMTSMLLLYQLLPPIVDFSCQKTAKSLQSPCDAGIYCNHHLRRAAQILAPPGAANNDSWRWRSDIPKRMFAAWKNERLPDLATVAALFIPALYLKDSRP